MLRLFLRPLFSVITVLTVCISMIRVGYALAFPLADTGVFTLSDCKLPCWMGLELGGDTLESKEAFLQHVDVTFARGTQTNFVVHDSLSGTLNDSVRIDSLTLMYTGCPLVLLMEMGQPDLIVQQGRNMNPFFYYREGIIMQFNAGRNYGDVTIYFQQRRGISSYINQRYNRGTVVDFDSSLIYGLVMACEW